MRNHPVDCAYYFVIHIPIDLRISTDPCIGEDCNDTICPFSKNYIAPEHIKTDEGVEDVLKDIFKIKKV